MGLQVHEPTECGDWHFTRGAAHYDEKVSIGMFEEHAFLIRDIQKLANVFAAELARHASQSAVNLQRHAKTCMTGVTKVVGPNEQVKAPPSAFEKAFYPNPGGSKLATQWLEYESRKRGVHIQHDLCGHGGEWYINNAPVDGYEPKSQTVFQYHGCSWHGCPKKQ